MPKLDGKEAQRIFIAVPIDELVKHFLQEKISPYKDTNWGKQMRWSALDNLHLTLRFLGDTEKSILDKIISDLPTALRNISQLEVGLSAPRPFPTVARPRVVAGLIHPSNLLDELVRHVDDCVADFTSIKRYKHFRGHITVGRYRRPAPPPTELLKNDSTTSLKIGKVIVFKSELLATGAKHTPLLTINLQP